MKDRLPWLRKNTAIVFFSVIISFLFVAIITYAATTISTNVNTGGTLTVTGASTLTGAVWATSTLQVTGNVTTYGATVLNENSAASDFRVESDGSTHMLYVDGTNNRVGIGSSTPIAFFSVGEGAGTLTGDIYMTGGLTVGATSTVNSIEGTVLLASSRTADPIGTEGLIYYNSSSKKVRLYNGTSWGVIGTSSGLDLIGSNIRMVTQGTDYFTLGTTTAQGASLATLEATSTLAIPLSLVARVSQAANLFQINDSGSANLFYVNSAGGIFGSSTAQVTGAMTGYGTLTLTGAASLNGAVTLGDAALDVITINGNASTTNALTVAGNFYVGGNATTTSGGALTLNGALVANGAVTLGDAALDVITINGNASTTNALTVGGNFYVGGNATTTSGGAISTQSTLTVTGLASLNGNASTTRLSLTDNFMVNGLATTTAADGNIATQGSLTVVGTSGFTGKVTAVNASTTRFTASDYASTTSLIVGGNGSTITGLIFGYCTIPTITINASSTDYADCSGATGIRSGDRVLVQATSSLPNNFILQAASSTGVALINVRIYNTGYDNRTGQGASDATGVNSFNFIGIR